MAKPFTGDLHCRKLSAVGGMVQMSPTVWFVQLVWLCRAVNMFVSMLLVGVCALSYLVPWLVGRTFPRVSRRFAARVVVHTHVITSSLNSLFPGWLLRSRLRVHNNIAWPAG
jgi:uncharacterized membrane protein